MTMEARPDFKRSAADEPLSRNRRAEDRNAARSQGAGLYAEVRPSVSGRTAGPRAHEGAD